MPVREVVAVHPDAAFLSQIDGAHPKTIQWHSTLTPVLYEDTQAAVMTLSTQPFPIAQPSKHPAALNAFCELARTSRVTSVRLR